VRRRGRERERGERREEREGKGGVPGYMNIWCLLNWFISELLCLEVNPS
jgi:hypothetical protein